MMTYMMIEMRLNNVGKAIASVPRLRFMRCLLTAMLCANAVFLLFTSISPAVAAESVERPHIAVVDLAAAAEKMPEKKEIEARVKTQIEALDREIQVRWKEVEKLSDDFKASQKALSAKGQAEQQAEIIRKEKNISEYWTKRSEEIKRSATEGTGVFSDLIRSSIAEMARQQGFDLVFDKENGRLLHASDRFDHTQELLEILKRVSKSSPVPKSSGAGATNTPPLRNSRLKTP